MISIIMLTYNAPEFVEHSILTLQENTQNVPYELIVLDNNSEKETRKLLLELQKKGYIDKLIFEKTNTLFARGNNTAAKLCAKDSTHILLLNSDIEVCSKDWLKNLLEYYEKGAVSYGVCEGEPHVRADGYCFLIDKELYLKYQLDEEFEWWWSVTKLQAQLLRDSYTVKAIRNHSTQLIHYGGMSGTAWKNSKGMLIEGEEIKKWFAEREIEIISEVMSNDSQISESDFTKRVMGKKKTQGFMKRLMGR